MSVGMYLHCTVQNYLFFVSINLTYCELAVLLTRWIMIGMISLLTAVVSRVFSLNSSPLAKYLSNLPLVTFGKDLLHRLQQLGDER